jgi:hypothetical protein
MGGPDFYEFGLTIDLQRDARNQRDGRMDEWIDGLVDETNVECRMGRDRSDKKDGRDGKGVGSRGTSGFTIS